jgi:hypothetical protein
VFGRIGEEPSELDEQLVEATAPERTFHCVRAIQAARRDT